MKPPLIEELDFYYQEGLLVFTRKYHLDRGYCCGLGCLHCPFDFKNVPEPQRAKLREKARTK